MPAGQESAAKLPFSRTDQKPADKRGTASLAPHGLSSLQPLLDQDGGHAFTQRLKADGGSIIRVAAYRSWNTELPDWRDRMDALIQTCTREHVRLRVALLDHPQASLRRGFPDWCLRVARRFPQIREYVVWNEPNAPAFWRGTPQQYGALLRDTHRALKHHDPKLRVSGFGLATSHGPLAFMHAARPWPRLDALSIHPYGDQPLLFLRNAALAAPGLPIDVDESCWPARPGDQQFLEAARRHPSVASVLRYTPP